MTVIFVIRTVDFRINLAAQLVNTDSFEGADVARVTFAAIFTALIEYSDSLDALLESTISE